VNEEMHNDDATLNCNSAPERKCRTGKWDNKTDQM